MEKLGALARSCSRDRRSWMRWPDSCSHATRRSKPGAGANWCADRKPKSETGPNTQFTETSNMGNDQRRRKNLNETSVSDSYLRFQKSKRDERDPEQGWMPKTKDRAQSTKLARAGTNHDFSRVKTKRHTRLRFGKWGPASGDRTAPSRTDKLTKNRVRRKGFLIWERQPSRSSELLSTNQQQYVRTLRSSTKTGRNEHHINDRQNRLFHWSSTKIIVKHIGHRHPSLIWLKTKNYSWHTNPNVEIYMKFGEVGRSHIPLGSYI
jgi:hypothetical protein